MLSWSSTDAGNPADLTALIDGDGDAGLAFGRELIAFADGITGYDDDALARARAALVVAAGEAFMVDAAAVAANFEMMTRVADGTGARFPPESSAGRTALDERLGIRGMTSARP
jgi:hypothetical protein